jgi:hypothetical protein
VTFYETLTAAVKDLLEHGFDSKERIEYWVEQIALAAEKSLIPHSTMTAMLKKSLTTAFERATNHARLMKAHPGIGKFTVDRIRPALRAELDRRIMASADLITLNRKASVDRTLRRFVGWASSVPAGGSKVQDRVATKTAVRRGIAGLPFEERRVIIDQGHKLVVAVNDIIARDGGAVAAVWEHVMETTPGYDPRPAHVARDGVLFVIRNNWAIEKGYMKLAGRQYTDEIEQPAELVFCRCKYRYLYTVRALPSDMITERGAEALAEARRVIHAIN